MTPNIGSMFTWTGLELNPERLVTMYSFAYYLQSTPARASAFATLVRRIETSDQVPPIDEVAKFYGFESADAFQTDWIEFIKITSFK